MVGRVSGDKNTYGNPVVTATSLNGDWVEIGADMTITWLNITRLRGGKMMTEETQRNDVARLITVTGEVG